MMKWSRMTLSAKVGLCGILFFFAFALIGPLLSPYAGDQIVGKTWEEPSAAYWLGTDQIGRDLMTRLMYGTRYSILLAGAAMLISFFLGSVLGFFAAVVKGWVDQTLSRLIDLIMSIPTLIFALVVLSVLPRDTSVLVVVTGVLDCTRVFRLSRSVAVGITVQDYVEAARLRGEKTGWIMFREILPNALTPLVAEFGLRFAFCMLFLSSLSFLGLGIQPPEADLGRMIRDNREGIVYGKLAAIFPGGALALLALSVNLLVDYVIKRTSSLKGGRGA